MEKIYKANLEYNKRERTKTIALGIILLLFVGGFATFLIIKQQWTMLPIVAILAIFPFLILPQAFKNYPVDDRPILIMKDKEIVAGKEVFKYKEILRFEVLITLPASKIDQENKDLLAQMASAKLEDEYMGSLDFVVKDAKGKDRVIYSSIDHVIDGMNTMLEMGVKNYRLLFNIKKNTVQSTHDYRRDISLRIEKEKNETLSKKEKLKQLI